MTNMENQKTQWWKNGRLIGNTTKIYRSVLNYIIVARNDESGFLFYKNMT